MAEKPTYVFHFNVWIETHGYATYEVRTTNPNIQILKAFSKTVKISQERGNPIPTTYRGQEILWEFAYGAEGETVEYIDPTKTFVELGIRPGDTITVGPPDVLGSGPDERVRYDRRQLIDFIELNASVIEPVKITPRAYRLRLKGVNGVARLAANGSPELSAEHEFEIMLGDDYPLRPPALRPISDIFHPNVSMAERKMCGWIDWRAEQEQILPWICVQVCDLVQYRKVNLEEPHRRMNLAASEWYEREKRLNPQRFPLSRKTFRGAGPTCRYCSRQVSSRDAVCPHCGRPQR